MLSLGPFPNSDKELFLLIPDRASYAENIAEIGMAALVKRPGESDPGLNGNKFPSPVYLFSHPGISGSHPPLNPASLFLASSTSGRSGSASFQREGNGNHRLRNIMGCPNLTA